MLSTEVSIIVFPEKRSACDEALAAAIYALIPLVALVVTVGYDGIAASNIHRRAIVDFVGLTYRSHIDRHL